MFDSCMRGLQIGRSIQPRSADAAGGWQAGTLMHELFSAPKCVVHCRKGAQRVSFSVTRCKLTLPKAFAQRAAPGFDTLLCPTCPLRCATNGSSAFQH
jgi:hypothetical protein